MFSHQILAVAASSATADWTQTPIGKYIVWGMQILGGIILVFAIVKSIGSFMSGKIGAGVKIILGAGFVAAFMLDPSLINVVINVLSGILEKVGETLSGGNTGG